MEVVGEGKGEVSGSKVDAKAKDSHAKAVRKVKAAP